MNRIVTALAALATTVTLGAAPAVLIASPAAADTGTCVDRGEFRKVVRGMKIDRVHAIFDVSGRQSYFSSGYPGQYGWPATQSRTYKPCTRYSYVSVDYERINGVWKVDAKNAYWG